MLRFGIKAVRIAGKNMYEWMGKLFSTLKKAEAAAKRPGTGAGAKAKAEVGVAAKAKKAKAAASKAMINLRDIKASHARKPDSSGNARVKAAEQKVKAARTKASAALKVMKSPKKYKSGGAVKKKKK